MSKNLWLKRIRNICGFLGMILPWLALLGSYLSYKNGMNVDWNNLSISASYFYTPALTAVLTAASIVLMTYDGYEKKDNIITTISGVFGLLIVLFPVSGVAEDKFIGFFQTPQFISNLIHCGSSGVFFCLLAVNSYFFFTLGEDKPTTRKKIRNIIYKICGIGMVGSFFLLLAPHFFAQTFVVEAIALTFFGISWLIKGQAFGILEDK